MDFLVPVMRFQRHIPCFQRNEAGTVQRYARRADPGIDVGTGKRRELCLRCLPQLLAAETGGADDINSRNDDAGKAHNYAEKKETAPEGAHDHMATAGR